MTDRDTTKTLLYEHSQEATFPDNIKRLATKKIALLPYSPFTDSNLLCARGRLRHLPMPDATKYPVILHAKEPSIQLMIENAHQKCMLLGTEFVRHYLQQSFIILGLRKALRHIRHHCFLCRRFQGKGLSPFMADLPAQRFDDPETNPYTFKNVGFDYIGPFYIAKNDTSKKN